MIMHILLTGVSSGIGYAIAQTLVSHHHLYGISRSPCDLPLAHHFVYDLRNHGSFEQIVQYFQHNNITLDACIFNAGVGYFGPFANISPEQHEEMIITNLLAPLLLFQALLPVVSSRAYHIFIGSSASKKFFKYGAGYQASKFGLRGLVGALAREYPRFRFHLLHPNYVATNFHAKSNQGNFDQYPHTPMESIIATVHDILAGKETRREIDL